MKSKTILLLCIFGLTLSCTKQGQLDNTDISGLIANFTSSVGFGGSMSQPSSVSFSFNMATDLHDLDHNNPHDPADFETTGIRFHWEMDLYFYLENGRFWNDIPLYSYRFSSEEFQDEQSWSDEILLTEFTGLTAAELDTTLKHVNRAECFITCTAEYEFYAVYGQMRRDASEDHKLVIQ